MTRVCVSLQVPWFLNAVSRASQSVKVLSDSATEEDYNLWSSEEEDQLVFPHHSYGYSHPSEYSSQRH